MIDKRKISTTIGESRFLPFIAKLYAFSPSAIMIRVAEADLISNCQLEQPMLDLCCGDGNFCSLIHPKKRAVGSDLSMPALRRAYGLGQYKYIACADISQGIPFKSECFQTVVSNSALEHINGIDMALREIHRVLRRGGKLYMTFGTNYAYQWWPCGRKALTRYLDYQPVFNYYSLQEWEKSLNRAGLEVIDYQYYLSKRATRILMFLDYHFSLAYRTSDLTIFRPLIRIMKKISAQRWAWLWSKLFKNIKILTQDEGGGILIIARRVMK